MGYHSGCRYYTRAILKLESKRCLYYRSEWYTVELEGLKTTYGATVVVVEWLKIVT